MRQSRQIRAVVDVVFSGDFTYPATRQVGARVGERQGARPANVFKDGQMACARRKADQPITSIAGRAKDRIRATKRCESAGNVAGSNSGNIAADHDDRASRRGSEDALKSLSKIAGPLLHANQSRWKHGTCHRRIGCDSEDRLPARAGRNPLQGERKIGAKEARGGHRADVAGQPGFDAPGQRLLGHHDEARCEAQRARCALHVRLSLSRGPR